LPRPGRPDAAHGAPGAAQHAVVSRLSQGPRETPPSAVADIQHELAPARRPARAGAAAAALLSPPLHPAAHLMLDLPPLMDRREFMKLMSAALALAAGGCAHPPLEQIVPYTDGQERRDNGEPLYFATALTQGGYAQGVLVRSNMGRPTKVEGNPRHPASLGATSPVEQGRILELWDPERSRA